MSDRPLIVGKNPKPVDGNVVPLDDEGYAKNLEGAIERHRQQVMSLGLHSNSRGELVWGGQYDAELWAVIGLPDRPGGRVSPDA